MSVHKYDEDYTVSTLNYSMIQMIFSYLKPHRIWFFLIFIFGIVATIFSLVYILLIGNLINDVIIGTSMDVVFLTIFFLSILVFCSIFFQWLHDRFLLNVRTKISIMIRNDLIDKLKRLPQRFFDENPHGKILTRITNYVDSVTNVICNVLLDFILQIGTFLLILGFMLSLHVTLTLILLVLILLFTGIFIFITPIWKKAQKRTIDKSTNAFGFLSESLKGVLITQAFIQNEKSVKTWDDLNEERMSTLKPLFYFSGLTWSLSGIFDVISLVLVYVLGFAFFYPAISIGNIIAMGNYSSKFWTPISKIASIYGSIIDGITSLEQIFHFLNQEEEKQGGLEKLSSLKGKIDISNVSFGYQEDTEVLHSLTMHMKPGQTVAIVGHTGSGKSTLAKLLLRLYEIDSGTIFFDDVDISYESLFHLRNKIKLMNQDSYLFAQTIEENIRIGKPDCSFDEIQAVCKKLKINEWILSLKDGYQTMVLNQGNNFSAGEKQFICIARLIISNPVVAILDEATSNIDVLTETEIVSAFFEAFHDKTTIVIAHRLSTIMHSDVIFVLDHGILLEQGNHDELMKLKGKYYDLFLSQTI